MKMKHAFMLALGAVSLWCSPLSAVEYWAQGVDEFFYTQQVGPTGCGRATAASLIYWWQRESGIEDPVNSTLDQILGAIDQHFIDSGDPTTGGTFVHDGLKWYMKEYYPDVELDQVYWQSDILWSSVPGVQGGIVYVTADKHRSISRIA